MEKTAKYTLISLAVILLGIFFISRELSGDLYNVEWRFSLVKTHLAHELSMRYFTPVHCGGFHLAADAQDFIFTLYTLVSFIIPNAL